MVSVRTIQVSKLTITASPVVPYRPALPQASQRLDDFPHDISEDLEHLGTQLTDVDRCWPGNPMETTDFHTSPQSPHLALPVPDVFPSTPHLLRLLHSRLHTEPRTGARCDTWEILQIYPISKYGKLGKFRKRRSLWCREYVHIFFFCFSVRHPGNLLSSEINVKNMHNYSGPVRSWNKAWRCWAKFQNQATLYDIIVWLMYENIWTIMYPIFLWKISVCVWG